MTTSIQQCVICHEELDRELSAAPCGHVFHNVCIDRWLHHGSYCPICHKELLPQGLLRLFFEPKQEAVQTPLPRSSGSVSDGTEPSSGCGVDEYHQQRASSDLQVIRLRRELASMIELNKKKSEESNNLSRKLGEIQYELVQTKASHANLTATNDATKVDLSKAKEENRWLWIELGKARKICHRQREVAFDFVQDIPSNMMYSRPCKGLGQVNAAGFASTSTAIRGQSEELPRSSERVWRPHRVLVSRDPLQPRQSMTDNEEREIGFQDLRANPVGSKREYRCLSEEPSGSGSYDNTPPMGLTRENAQIMEHRRGCQVHRSLPPQRLVVEPRHGNSRGTKRPAPEDVTDPTQVIWKGLSVEKPRASTLESITSMILLGSDEENGNEAGKGWPEFDEWRDEQDMSGIALDWPNGAVDASGTSDMSPQFPLPGSRRGLD